MAVTDSFLKPIQQATEMTRQFMRFQRHGRRAPRSQSTLRPPWQEMGPVRQVMADLRIIRIYSTAPFLLSAFQAVRVPAIARFRLPCTSAFAMR
jgi:hypothetical protein